LSPQPTLRPQLKQSTVINKTTMCDDNSTSRRPTNKPFSLAMVWLIPSIGQYA
jgi:hypothetical protein